MDRPASRVDIPTPDGEAGILLWDKPAGVTSHDVVEMVRREVGMKVGHAGTLDPFATGLLVILLGRATRLQRYLMEMPKRYEARARFGWTSSTGDPDGELIETSRVPEDPEIPAGTIEQQVPMTSAVKVEGERLYRKAHRGELLEDRPSREVTVHASRLVELERDPDGGSVGARYDLTVSSGTYVRTLITELGDAYCTELRRTEVGDLKLDRAGSLVDIEEALSTMPRIEAIGRQAVSVANGVPLPAPQELIEGTAVRLASEEGLIGVGRVADDMIRPEVVIRPAQG